jgi:hypothetical protein
LTSAVYRAGVDLQRVSQLVSVDLQAAEAIREAS